MSETNLRAKPDDRRVSPIIYNSPATPGRRGVAKVPIQSKSPSTQTRVRIDSDMETVPDSEEERRNDENERKKEPFDSDIIEISSDEEDRDLEPIPGDPFVSKIPGAWPADGAETIKATNAGRLSDGEWSCRTPHTMSKLRRAYHSRMIVWSSSSEDSDGDHPHPQGREIIELSDSSSQWSPKRGSKKNATRPIPAGPKTLAFCSDEEDSCGDDGAVLTLNEPRSARKPININPSHARSIAAIADPKLTSTPRPKRPKDSPGTISTPRSESSLTKPKQAPLTGKKAQAAAEQARRAVYAQRLFMELNHVVFGDGLPQDTKLNWNKRLLTTAGRAKWHKSRDGVQTTEIELAEKILDCEERIRNTLSHEMCHLATWIIDANPREGHGKLWKGWVAKVMRKRPEIAITTRHNYEISHPFEWECEKCAKVYGRFSKSIRPDECVCGACKEGKLVPLFSRGKKMPKTSRNASTRPNDSPCSLPRSQVVHRNEGEIDDAHPAYRPEDRPVYTVHDSDSESDPDIKGLTTGVRSIAILASKTI